MTERITQAIVDDVKELVLFLREGEALLSAVVGLVPVLGYLVYRNFIRVPPAERAVKFSWTVAKEAQSVVDSARSRCRALC